jgi:hypothetical protein
MPAPPTPTPQQQTVNKTVVPQMNTPLVSLTTGQIEWAWYRLITDLFRKTGSGFSTTTDMAYLQLESGVLNAYDVNGNLIGHIAYT